MEWNSQLQALDLQKPLSQVEDADIDIGVGEDLLDAHPLRHLRAVPQSSLRHPQLLRPSLLLSHPVLHHPPQRPHLQG